MTTTLTASLVGERIRALAVPWGPPCLREDGAADLEAPHTVGALLTALMPSDVGGWLMVTACHDGIEADVNDDHISAGTTAMPTLGEALGALWLAVTDPTTTEDENP